MKAVQYTEKNIELSILNSEVLIGRVRVNGKYEDQCWLELTHEEFRTLKKLIKKADGNKNSSL